MSIQLDLRGENDTNLTAWPMSKLSGKYLSPQSPKEIQICKDNNYFLIAAI